MAVTPPLRYIHIDDYSPGGFDNGPDDAAFANARADLAAYGYHTLVIGPKQYWLQNGFNLNAYTDFNGISYPSLTGILITSDSFTGGGTSGSRVYYGLPGTMILSPGYADPTLDVYVGGTEPYRTTGAIRLNDNCGVTNLRIMSLQAYLYSRSAGANLDNAALVNGLIWGQVNGMAAPVSDAGGLLNMPAGGGTAIQMDGPYCYVDNLVILGFRTAVAATQQGSGNGGASAETTVGWLKGDFANGVRLEQTSAGGRIDGPIVQAALLDAGLTGSPTAGSEFAITVETVTGSTASTTLSISETTLLGNVASYASGMPLTVILVSPSGGACFSPFNTSNQNAAGFATNRFSTTVLSASGNNTATALTLGLPNISWESFFDATAIGNSGTGTGSISTTNMTTMLGTATLTLSSMTEGLAAGYLVTGGGVQPGTVIAGSGMSGVYPVSVAQAVSGELISVLGTGTGASAGAVIEGSIPANPANPDSVVTTLVVKGLIAGTGVEVGQLLLGDGIPSSTTITSSGSSSSEWIISPGIPGGVSNETIALLPSVSATAGITSNGTTTTLTTSTSLTLGQGLYGASIVPGSYVASMSGSSPYVVDVLQAVGSATQPVTFIAQQPGEIFAGYVTGGGGTLSVTPLSGGSGSVSIATGSPLVGSGISANVYVTGPAGSNTYTLNSAQAGNVASLGAPEIMFAPSGAAITGSISGTVLTVLSSSSTLALSTGDILNGSEVLPGTTITGAISTLNGTGLYAVAPQQQVGSSSGTITATAVPSTTFLGSISGTTLTISPAGTFAIGQFISSQSLSSTTTITSTATGGSGSWTYSINPGHTGTITEAMTAIPTAALFTATIGSGGEPSNIMSITGTLAGTLAIGQQITGPGITAPTYIIAGSGSTFTLSTPYAIPTLTVFTASASSGGTFTGSVTSGSTSLTISLASAAVNIPGVGDVIVGAGIPSSTYVGAITFPSTESAVATLTNSATATLMGPMAAIPAESNFVGTVTGSTLKIALNNSPFGTAATLAAPIPLLGSGVEQGTSITGSIESSGVFPTYAVSIGQSTGTILAPETLIAVNSADGFTIEGHISRSVFVVSSIGTIGTGTTLGTLAIGQDILGYGIASGTAITSLGSNSGTTAGTYAIGVSQALSVGPMTALANAAVVSGMVSGTSFSGTVVAGTLTTGQILSAPGLAIGTVASTTVSIAAGSSFTGSVRVLQYLPSGSTVYAAGQLLVGSVGGLSSNGTGLSVLQGSTATVVSVGSILYSPGLLPGTNVAAGTSSPYTLAVPQPAPAVSQTFTFTAPLSTSGTLTLGFAPTRPGRLIDLNNAVVSVGAVTAYGASTAIGLTYSNGVTINDLSYDGPAPDMTTTVIDLQNASEECNIIAAGVVDAFTFLNNETPQINSGGASALRLANSNISVTNGGTLINNSGGSMLVVGSTFAAGTILFQTPQPASFASCAFTASGSNPTELVYWPGAGPVVFDQTCLDVPEPATANAFSSPFTSLMGSLSAAIGGQLGSDFGRSGYLAIPSAANFAALGDRQTGLTALGSSNAGSIAQRLTSDGLAVATNGVNSLGNTGTALTYGQGFVVAYQASTALWALWPAVKFLLVYEGPGATTLPSTSISGTGTAPIPSGSGAASWSFSLAADATNSCLNATGTGSGSGTIHWLFGINCLDIA